MQSLKINISSKYTKNINSLDLSFRSDNWHTILKSLQLIKLYKLSMKNCKLTHEQLPKLLKYLTNPNTHLSTTIKILILDGNMLGNKGCRLLLQIQMINLQELSLNDCNLRDSGCKVIAKIYYPCIRALYIKNNNIGVQGWVMCLLMISDHFIQIVIGDTDTENVNRNYQFMDIKLGNIIEPIIMMNWAVTSLNKGFIPDLIMSGGKRDYFKKIILQVLP